MSRELTPIERGVLIALMAAGGRLRESADLKARFGIVLRPAHRTKLQGLGLVTTTTKPLAHELTERGWAWLQDELVAAQASPIPKGQMGMGALYALLAGVGRYAQQHGGELARLFQTSLETPRSPSPDASVPENAWRLADESLARALQQTPRLRSAIEPAAGLDRELRRYIGETIDALRHASRAREMEIVGQPGEVTAFDALYHSEDDQGFRSGDQVKIVRPAIVQGNGAYRRAIRKAQVCDVG